MCEGGWGMGYRCLILGWGPTSGYKIGVLGRTCRGCSYM